MNSMGKLIKSGTVPFVDALLKNYSKLNLNEQETMILIQLQFQLSENNLFSTKALASRMVMSASDISYHFLNLVERGLIELSISNEQTETFNLDGAYNLLGEVLENGGKPKDNRESTVRDIIGYVESSFSRSLSASDLAVINTWASKNYPIDDIKKAVLEASKNNKTHIKYVDAILNSRLKTRTPVEEEIDPELISVLESINVKR